MTVGVRKKTDRNTFQGRRAGAAFPETSLHLSSAPTIYSPVKLQASCFTSLAFTSFVVKWGQQHPPLIVRTLKTLTIMTEGLTQVSLQH